MEKCIVQLIDEMSVTERCVFVSYFYNQMSTNEIAQETGSSEYRIRQYLLSAIRKVITIIGQGGMYYAALMIFLAMGNEAVMCQPP